MLRNVAFAQPNRRQSESRTPLHCQVCCGSLSHDFHVATAEKPYYNEFWLIRSGEGTMNRALADDALRSKLGEFRAQTEIYDKDGRVLGVFTPEDVRERRRYERAK